MNFCRCGRDIHPSPLSETVAGFYAKHSFPEDYDPETDLSPIVCPGSFTEGPVRPLERKPGVTLTFLNNTWQAINTLTMEPLKVEQWHEGNGWKVVGTLADEGITTWSNGGYSCDFGKAKFTLHTDAGGYTAGMLQQAKWSNPSYGFKPLYQYVIYDEMWDDWQPSKKECPGDPPEFTFGPQNWVKKPSDPLFGWKPWENCLYADIYGIPPINHPVWKEPIPLPDLPVDYTEVAKQFNEQFSYAGVK